ncbi:Transposase [Minicystis rosea]|nr:Transposase [Minicystis rosea]
MTQLIVYALAVSARRFGLQVHAFCAMSTHLHLVVTDVEGVLPRFLQFFHRLVALGTKVLRHWEGAVWDHEATSVVRLLTRTAVVEKIAYVLANPVSAGLVRRARDWPGAKTHVGEMGQGTIRATRPSAYLDQANPSWPKEASLALTLPPTIKPGEAEAFRRDVAAELERQEVQSHEEMRRRGMSFLGAERARKVSPHDRATSVEPSRDRNPTFAVGAGQGDTWRAAARAVRAFRASYRVAVERWRAGMRAVVFPVGTWWMQVFHGASIADPLSTEPCAARA